MSEITKFQLSVTNEGKIGAGFRIESEPMQTMVVNVTADKSTITKMKKAVINIVDKDQK